MSEQEIQAVIDKGGWFMFDKPPFDKCLIKFNEMESFDVLDIADDDNVMEYCEDFERFDLSETGWREATQEEIERYVK